MFSSQDQSSPGLFSRLREKVTPSKEDTYKQQMEAMAQKEVWTLGDFNDQIQSSMDWKSKLPGLGNNAVVQQMKSMGKLLEAAIEVMGRDSGALELSAMDKKEKLQIGIKCGASLNDINGLISQFENLAITHKVLRYRALNGLEIPTDEASAKKMMQTDLQHALSPKELKLLRKQQMKAQKRRM